MREWKMQEWKLWEQTAGMENAGATKYGKPSEENNLRYQTKYQLTLKYQTVVVAFMHTCCQTQLASESAC